MYLALLENPTEETILTEYLQQIIHVLSVLAHLYRITLQDRLCDMKSGSNYRK